MVGSPIEHQGEIPAGEKRGPQRRDRRNPEKCRHRLPHRSRETGQQERNRQRCSGKEEQSGNHGPITADE